MRVEIDTEDIVAIARYFNKDIDYLSKEELLNEIEDLIYDPEDEDCFRHNINVVEH